MKTFETYDLYLQVAKIAVELALLYFGAHMFSVASEGSFESQKLIETYKSIRKFTQENPDFQWLPGESEPVGFRES